LYRNSHDILEDKGKEIAEALAVLRNEMKV